MIAKKDELRMLYLSACINILLSVVQRRLFLEYNKIIGVPKFKCYTQCKGSSVTYGIPQMQNCQVTTLMSP